MTLPSDFLDLNSAAAPDTAIAGFALAAAKAVATGAVIKA